MAIVGEIIPDDQLVGTRLSGFPKKWDGVVDGIVAREHLPNWGRMWDDFFQEEIRRNAKSGSQRGGVDEEKNVSFAAQGKKKY